MKKAISRVLVLLVLLAVSMNAMAAGFRPSATNQGGPILVVTPDDEGREVIGNIVEKDGSIYSTEYHECVLITQVSKAETSTRIPQAATELLLQVYKEIIAPDADFSKIFANLPGAKDMVVRDLFDITALCDELKIELPKNDRTIDLTFKLGVGKDELLNAMIYINGVWQKLPCKNNGDGTATVTFSRLDAPVAFLVPQKDDGTSSNPKTGETVSNDFAVWGVVMGASVLMAAGLLVSLRKKEEN